MHTCFDVSDPGRLFSRLQKLDWASFIEVNSSVVVITAFLKDRRFQWNRTLAKSLARTQSLEECRKHLEINRKKPAAYIVNAI